MSTEIEKHNGINRNAFEPTSMKEAMWLASELCNSGLLPSGIKSPQDALIILIQGRELGLTAIQSIRSINIIDGRPALSAQLMQALVLRSGLAETFEQVESTPEVATYETKRAGASQPTRLSWTIQQAEAAGLLGRKNWRAYPSEMLRARCISALCRESYPDVVAGLYTPDELTGTGSDDNKRRKAKPKATATETASDAVLEAEVIKPADAAERASLIAKLKEAREILGQDHYRDCLNGSKPETTEELRKAARICEREVSCLLADQAEREAQEEDEVGPDLDVEPTKSQDKAEASTGAGSAAADRCQPDLFAEVEVLEFVGFFLEDPPHERTPKACKIGFSALSTISLRAHEGMGELLVVDGWAIPEPTEQTSHQALWERRFAMRDRIGLPPELDPISDAKTAFRAEIADYESSMEKGQLVGHRKVIVNLDPGVTAEMLPWPLGLNKHQPKSTVLNGEWVIHRSKADFMGIAGKLELLR